MDNLDVILKPITPDLEELYVQPETSQTTEIGMMLAKSIIPIHMGIFSVPKRMLEEIQKVGDESEKISELEAIKVYLTVLKIHRKLVITPDSIDISNMTEILDSFVYLAIAEAPRLLKQFTKIIIQFCNDVKEQQNSVASTTAWQMSQTTGQNIPIDIDSLKAATANCIQQLNVIAAGMNGYKILALTKMVDDIGRLLNNSKIQEIYNVSNAVALFNKLKFRINPGQIQFHKQLDELLNKIKELNDFDTTKIEASQQLALSIFMISEQILSKLNNLVNFKTDVVPKIIKSIPVVNPYDSSVQRNLMIDD
jgi:hypothetical protein